MSRPRRYTLKDGTQIPGVTTIINARRDPGGLMWWSWQEGMCGRDYRETRDAAADSGTLAHAMVEADIRGRAFTAPANVDAAVLERAQQAFDNYQEWRTLSHLEPVEAELSLVSERYRFAGTLDAMLVGGKLGLGDWKSSNAVYADHLIQLAAYGILWAENFPERPIEGGYHLLRVAKDAPDFAHHHFGDLADAARAFLLLRELYDLDKALKARVR